jgi:hypothetical protein
MTKHNSRWSEAESLLPDATQKEKKPKGTHVS